ncbi:MAG: hypothetical protein ONB17_03465 [candidate division KSB1 bacterium]|nr:hypothetical protein [candidate division KSB1 bacterium]MDZ7295802.1 hypothetical protein [candidate division KSB1 bacterium]MDZ7386428.1 hypothetical protein [candidate division KSB1 bacterium]MDZ7392051.1 hypothetical protein [candidate division KSB1 bacterium]MDZ7411974.1 hypothetical protein [candidate division KSB1 bacterium]
MTSKERVHAALRREPTDRVPIFMWFHPDTAARLGKVLEIPPSMVGEAMGNDVRQTWVNNNYAMEGIVHAYEGEWHTDYWGIKWVKRGAFNQPEYHPLAYASPEQVRQYTFPIDRKESLLAEMEPVVRGGESAFIGCDVSPCAFEMYCRLRGMEQALVDLAADEDLAWNLLRACADFAAMLAQEACARFPLDWLWTGDDVASHRGLMMSPQTWRRLIKPHLARVVAVGKKRGLWVAYHCCGAMREIIPDLIEIGVDVLNPIQCNCPGMEPGALKREFGQALSFMGGLDNLHTIPYGTAHEVYLSTRALIEQMTIDGGGYILAASHTIPPEAPDENVFALVAAAGVSREEIFDRAADIRARVEGEPTA